MRATNDNSSEQAPIDSAVLANKGDSNSHQNISPKIYVYKKGTSSLDGNYENFVIEAARMDSLLGNTLNLQDKRRFHTCAYVCQMAKGYIAELVGAQHQTKCRNIIGQSGCHLRLT